MLAFLRGWAGALKRMMRSGKWGLQYFMKSEVLRAEL